jgi:hypothetical protein
MSSHPTRPSHVPNVCRESRTGAPCFSVLVSAHPLRQDRAARRVCGRRRFIAFRGRLRGRPLGGPPLAVWRALADWTPLAVRPSSPCWRGHDFWPFRRGVGRCRPPLGSPAQFRASEVPGHSGRTVPEIGALRWSARCRTIRPLGRPTPAFVQSAHYRSSMRGRPNQLAVGRLRRESRARHPEAPGPFARFIVADLRGPTFVGGPLQPPRRRRTNTSGRRGTLAASSSHRVSE